MIVLSGRGSVGRNVKCRQRACREGKVTKFKAVQ